MFNSIESSSDTAEQVNFIFNGQKISATMGMTVAAALLASGQCWFSKTAVSGQNRGPFCMMGTCYDCLVQIDDVSVQACMTQVVDGLVVNSVPALNSSKGRAT